VADLHERHEVALADVFRYMGDGRRVLFLGHDISRMASSTDKSPL
jgi:hypothetical protein